VPEENFRTMVQVTRRREGCCPDPTLKEIVAAVQEKLNLPPHAAAELLEHITIPCDQAKAIVAEYNSNPNLRDGTL